MAASTVGPLERARAISSLIREDGLDAERAGRLTPRVSAALLGAGLFSMLLPESEGGLGASRVEFFETVEEIARADGSAGWCLSVCSAVNDFIHRGATIEARREVLGAGPVAVWTSLGPFARSVAADGGFRVSGSFGMGSGSALASWVLVAAPLEDREGRQWFRAHIVPKSDVVIKEGSWDVTGLRATTSIDYTIEDQFVPAHRAFEYPFLQSETAGSISTLYGVFLNQVGLTAAHRTRRVVGVGMQSDDHVLQFGIGELDGRLRAARSHFLSLVAEQDRFAATHGWPDPAIAQDTSQAAQTLTRAARDLTVFAFDYAGTKVIFASHPIQRCLRDIFTGLKHAGFTPAVLTGIGRSRMGLGGQASRFT